MPWRRSAAGQRRCAARAKASLGWAATSIALEAGLTVPSGTMTAEARDSRAACKFFASSTKTKSPGVADSMLEIPDNGVSSSPITRPPTNSATALSGSGFTKRCMACFYTFAGGKESSGLELPHGARDFLAQFHGDGPAGGFHFAAVVGAGINYSDTFRELVDCLPQ